MWVGSIKYVCVCARARVRVCVCVFFFFSLIFVHVREEFPFYPLLDKKEIR